MMKHNEEYEDQQQHFQDEEDRGVDRVQGRDAARLGALLNNNGAQRERGGTYSGASIPMPSLGVEGEDSPTLESNRSTEVWNASGTMTMDDYQRLRKGYERGISPEALERMGEQSVEFSTPEQMPSHSTSYRSEEYSSGDPTIIPTEEERVRNVEHYGVPSPQPTVVRATPSASSSTRAKRSKSRIGPVGVTAILLVGIAGALLLYAGGAEYITGLFKKEEVVEENLTMVTERPGAAEEENEMTPTPGEEILSEDSTTDELQAEEALTEEMAPPHDAFIKEQDSKKAAEKKKDLERTEEKRSSDQVKDLTPVQSKTVSEKKATDKENTTKTQVSKPTSTEGTKASGEKTETQKTSSAPTPSTGSYLVQVKATPDKSEADRLASKLRSRGGVNIQIGTTQKNGQTFYQVRFGSFSSAEEARTKAAALGYEDIWVVKK